MCTVAIKWRVAFRKDSWCLYGGSLMEASLRLGAQVKSKILLYTVVYSVIRGYTEYNH